MVNTGLKGLGAVYTYPLTMKCFVASQPHIEGVVVGRSF